MIVLCECGDSIDSILHKPTESCDDCQRPSEHHTFKLETSIFTPEDRASLKWFSDEVLTPALELIPMNDYINADLEEGIVATAEEWEEKFEAGLAVILKLIEDAGDE